MRKGTKTFLSLLLLVALSTTVASSPVLAEDDAKNGAPASTDGVKLGAPKPNLTERERWLLDRVEQLEKRVEELEAKGEPARPSAPTTVLRIPPRSPEAAEIAATVPGSDASGSAGTSTALPLAGVEHSSKTATSPSSTPKKAEPFAFADFTWLNGNSPTKETPYATGFFAPEIRADVDYNYSFNHPKDDTIGGSSEVFRHGEVQLTQLGADGDFHYDNVRVRVMTQFGMYSQTTPRNDASPARGQWQLDNAYRSISEAYGGYHFNALHGINVDAGIFMSYIGLFSYYQFDNWAYQLS